ncbi:MAG TPA: hypothetical protein VL099_01665 [Candidatus Binatia bacterium]|nr:hypothetical protein [Candidatus Binatia bacterium]
MSEPETLDLALDRLAKPALGVGVAGALGLAAFGVMGDTTQFFRSYLFAFVFWMGVPLGSLALLMLHHLTGGGWGFVIRRLCEAGTRTFALMAVLFLPLFFGMARPGFYEWTRPGWAEESHSALKAVYLTPGFFRLRAVVYFAVWILLGYLLSKWSIEEDGSKDPEWHRKMEALSAPGLILFGMTSTFASVDWVMSLEPHWASTMYGLIFIVVQVLTALAFLILMARSLSHHQPLAAVASPSRFHDLGTLLFAFTMLWAYLSFSQFLIIWAGNLKSEIPWYLKRGTGSWAGLAVFLLLFHFALPFFILLNRPVKRNKRTLAVIAGGLMVISAVDVFWLVMPAFFPDSPAVHLTDFLAAAAIGGLWLWQFARQLRGRPLAPLGDSRMEAAVEHGA